MSSHREELVKSIVTI